MSLLALQDLFRRTREKATGVWKLGVEPGRTIYFEEGDAVFAQSTHLQDRLTYILVERGKVTQAQMDYALANLKPGLSIGKNLIEMGFITQRDLLEVAKAQVERIIHGALATPDQAPVFDEKELDANVVRLPLGTGQVFLAGVLGLKDREGLLELLGPLNQVVVLQGRRLMDLTLPPDLAKLPSLLDGTHTLLELSRESLAEPVRLGAFALFLREMGWARLHEMPPLDRQALDLALTPEPEPLSRPLAPAPEEEAFPVTVPSLFTTIEEAARPTANLEHLSQSLDEEPLGPPSFEEDLDELDELPPPPDAEPRAEPRAELRADEEGTLPGEPFPEAFPWNADAATGQAQLPTPAVPIPAVPEDEDEPRVVLHLPLEDLDEDAGPRTEAPVAVAAPASRVKLLGSLLILALVLVAGSLVVRKRLWRHGQALRPIPLVGVPVLVKVPAAAAKPGPGPALQGTPGPAANEPAKPGPAGPEPAKPEPAKPEPAKPEPAKPEPAKPEPAKAAPAKPEPVKAAPPAKPEPPLKPVSTAVAARLAALDKGDLALAVRQGEARVKEIPASHWTLRLEIACMGETLRSVSQGFKHERPDLFLLPIKWRDGRGCYQVLYGHFPSKEAAEKQLKHLPATFLASGNRPKAFKVSEIPKIQ